jgi:hypothetical protein
MNIHRTLLFIAFTVVAAPAAAQPAPDAPPPAAEAAPTTAVAALDRATAAYDYGDMNQVVSFTRPIVDGAFAVTPAQRAQALRLLGIGLYLTGRPAGAETQFLELLRAQPRTRLDPTTTRPEVVAFFENIRRRPEFHPHHSPLWNFLPPVGQFMNGDRARGYVFLGVEATSLATFVTTRLILESWRLPGPGSTFKNTDTARTLKTWHQISFGVFAATYALGVLDAFLRTDHDQDQPESRMSLFLLPNGAGLRATF